MHCISNDTFPLVLSIAYLIVNTRGNIESLQNAERIAYTFPRHVLINIPLLNPYSSFPISSPSPDLFKDSGLGRSQNSGSRTVSLDNEFLELSASSPKAHQNPETLAIIRPSIFSLLVLHLCLGSSLIISFDPVKSRIEGRRVESTIKVWVLGLERDWSRRNRREFDILEF